MRSDFCGSRLLRATPETTGAWIEDMFRERARGDFESLETFFTPDMTCEFFVPKTISACGGRIVGRPAFLESMKYLHSTYSWIEHVISDVRVEGERAIVQRWSISRNHGTGSKHRLNSCTLLRFRDGLIHEMIGYSDTVVLARLMDSDR